MTGWPDIPRSLGHSHNQASPARQFIIGDFREESQVKVQSLAFLICRVVEEVDDVASKSILDSAAFVEIERTRRIHFDLGMFAQYSTQFALECERSLPHFGHTQGNNVVSHRMRSTMGTSENARHSTSEA